MLITGCINVARHKWYLGTSKNIVCVRISAFSTLFAPTPVKVCTGTVGFAPHLSEMPNCVSVYAQVWCWPGRIGHLSRPKKRRKERDLTNSAKEANECRQTWQQSETLSRKTARQTTQHEQVHNWQQTEKYKKGDQPMMVRVRTHSNSGSE